LKDNVVSLKELVNNLSLQNAESAWLMIMTARVYS
jgi:hypothetical protein